MELDDAMRTTGAVRAFTDAPVDDATLYRVLERARFAPSGGNRQPWRVVVVQDPDQRRLVRELCVLGWREYVAFVEAGEVPFAPGPDGRPNSSGHRPRRRRGRRRSRHRSSTSSTGRPALLVIGAHLPSLAVLDCGSERQSIIGGGSVYPFAQNLLLSARNEGLGGVMTTFLARQDEAARERAADARRRRTRVRGRARGAREVPDASSRGAPSRTSRASTGSTGRRSMR